MPDLGGKKLGEDLKGMLAGVGKAMDEVRLEIAGAVSELVTEVRGGREVAKAIHVETMNVRQAWTSVLGNAQSAGEESAADARDVQDAQKPGGG